jgi:hypothetical protein
MADAVLHLRLKPQRERRPVKLLFYERKASMQAPRKELVPEAKLPKRRRAQLRDARRLLGLPQNPKGVDDVLEALALIDLDERYWAAGRVEYRKSTKVALRKALAALTRLKEAYAQLPDEYVRARSLDVYSINWHQLRKHTTAFEQDLKAKPKDPFKYVVHRKWFAARVALQLMHDHGLPTGAEREGKFHKLASILYGDPKADLYDQCCTVLSKKESGR